MLDGMEKFVGLRLTDEAVQRYHDYIDAEGKFITRPDFYGTSIHINMFIHVDRESMRITDFSGTKCYSVCRGLYNRSAPVHMREFNQKDMAYLRKFVKSITVAE